MELYRYYNKPAELQGYQSKQTIHQLLNKFIKNEFGDDDDYEFNLEHLQSLKIKNVKEFETQVNQAIKTVGYPDVFYELPMLMFSDENWAEFYMNDPEYFRKTFSNSREFEELDIELQYHIDEIAEECDKEMIWNN